MTPVSMSWLNVHAMPNLTNGKSFGSTSRNSPDVNGVPSIHSKTNTFFDVYSSYTFGTLISSLLFRPLLSLLPAAPFTTSSIFAVPSGPYRLLNFFTFSASFSKSISSNNLDTNSSTASTAFASTKLNFSKYDAANLNKYASASTCSRMLGLCTFTATTSCVFNRHLYTWHNDAAATDPFSSISSTFSMSSYNSGLSSRMVSIANWSLNRPMSSCNCPSAPANSGPTRSPRLAAACANFTYVGPSLEIALAMDS